MLKALGQRIADTTRVALRGLPARRRRVRAFSGAQIGRLTAGWTTQPRPADYDIKTALKRLVARSREQAENNDHVRQFLRLARVNVVGAPGIKLQARVLDGSGALNKNANQIIEDGWREWGRRGVPDVSGQYSWRMLQRLFITTVLRDGEILIRKQFSWRGNPYRFALEVYDAQQLDVDLNRDLGNGRAIVMGVELDKWRRPQAYHLLTGGSTGDDYYQYRGKKYDRVPASQIYHAFLPEWVWQTRGVPAPATALLRLNMLNGYEEAELIAARIASSKMGFFYEDEDATTEYEGDETQEEDESHLLDAEPGSFRQLPPGMRFEPWSPDHPTTAFPAFVKTTLRGIAAGLGVSYNSLANDLEGVNYSSLRQGALEDRDVWSEMQDWMVENLCEPVYRDWLGVALASDALPRLNMEDYQELARVYWQPRRWSWVDPAKEIKAQREAYGLRIRSISSIIREQGHDPDEVFEEIEEEKAKLAAMGIEPETAKAEQPESGVDEQTTDD